MNKKYDPYEEIRRDADPEGAEWRESLARFWRYLRTRRTESWGFFIAGLILGGLFF